MSFTLHCGDALTVLKTLPAESADCCVTSPPYWGLRQYFFDGAVCLKPELSEGEREAIQEELQRLGVKPKC